MELLIQHRWVKPEDINTTGILFGGRLTEWIDQDSSMACYKVLKPETLLTTVGMDRLRWSLPAQIGDRLKMTYKLAHIGKFSIVVYVAVENQKNQQIFRGLVSLVCLRLPDKIPSETSIWIQNESKGIGDALRSSPLWNLVEKVKSERESDPEWMKS